MDASFQILLDLDARIRRTTIKPVASSSSSSSSFTGGASRGSSSTSATATTSADVMLALVPSRVLADRVEAVVAMAGVLNAQWDAARVACTTHDATVVMFIGTGLLKMSDAFRGSSSVRVRETIAYAFDALLSKEALDAVGVGASTSSSSSSTHASVSAATPTKSTLNTTTSDDVLANVLHVLLSASSGDRVLALRILTALARWLRDRVDIHFYIRESLMAERSTAAERNAALRLAVTLCGGHIGNGGDGAGAAIGTNASTSSSTSIAFTRFIHADFITIIEQFNKNIDSARRWHRLDRDVLVEGMRVLCEYEPVVRELRRRVSSSAISGLDEQLSRLLQCEKKAKDDLMIVDV